LSTSFLNQIVVYFSFSMVRVLHECRTNH